MVPSEVIGFIRENSRFLVSSHVNPDGDGLGAAMAMKWALLKLGKEAEIIVDSPPPEMFGFFANYEWVRPFDEAMVEGEKFGAVITVDAPNTERLGKVVGLIAADAVTMNIDHHVSNENFGTVNFIDEESASSAEMAYRIIKELDFKADADCAAYIYTGMVVDTGRFRFSNTKPATMATASELVAAGVQTHKISEWLYERNSFETTRALGDFITSIELHMDGKVATAQFDHEYVSSEAWKKVDTEGFVNHALAIRGVEVSIFMREADKGITRASLRAKYDFDVNELAGIYGGGGHAKASGCTIKMGLNEAKESLLKECARLMGG